jgi:hypothetical protein
MGEQGNMINTSGLEYITRKETAWLKKYLQDKNADFAKLPNGTKNLIVTELFAPHKKSWLFTGWKMLLISFLVIILNFFLLPFVILLFPIILKIDSILFFSFEVIVLAIIYSLLWVRKLHTIAVSDKAKSLISK